MSEHVPEPVDPVVGPDFDGECVRLTLPDVNSVILCVENDAEPSKTKRVALTPEMARELAWLLDAYARRYGR